MNMPSTPNRRNRRTAEQWKILVTELDTGQLDSREFCDKYDVGLSTLRKWCSRFQDSTVKDPVGFVELPARSSRRDGLTTQSDGTRFQVRLDLGAGLVLEINRN